MGKLVGYWVDQSFYPEPGFRVPVYRCVYCNCKFSEMYSTCPNCRTEMKSEPPEASSHDSTDSIAREE